MSKQVFSLSKFLLNMRLNCNIINPTGKSHSATVIFFHGSGDTGNGCNEWVRFLLGKNMEFPHIKVIYPTAPIQPYTPLNGEMSNVWFDRKQITIEAKESRRSLASIYESVNELLDEELKAGIAPERIIVGGFSMGGALALHTGYHINSNLRGVFALSSFLNNGSIVYESLAVKKAINEDKLPELIMFHGDRDTLVPPHWGKITFDELIKLGINAKFITLENTLHELKKKELIELNDWIVKLLPPIDNDLTNKL